MSAVKLYVDKKDTMCLGIGVMFFVLSGLPVLLFPKQEALMSVFTMVMIVIGIIIMIMLGMAENPYTKIEKKPLFFDHDFLKESKSEYARHMSIYMFIYASCRMHMKS